MRFLSPRNTPWTTAPWSRTTETLGELIPYRDSSDDGRGKKREQHMILGNVISLTVVFLSF